MNKTTLPQGVRQLAKWHGKGTLKFDLPIQRASGQWSLINKSLLVHSILADYPIPAIYLVKYKGKDKEAYYQALDGKQRCTSLFEFINGGYALHGSTPDVRVDGVWYVLANKTFDELTDDCKDLVLGYRFTVYVIEDATDEEIEEAFARLNASVPLTLIQKARTEMGTELAGWTREITQLPFFQHRISLTVAQARRESELEVLLQSMLLMDAKDKGYQYTAISMSGVMKYCHVIRGDYGDERRTVVRCITEYLTDAFPEVHKFLKKSNVPMVFVMADLAMQNDIAPDKFKAFIDSFAGSVCPAYEENMGSGNIKRAKTEGRLLAMFKEMVAYFHLPADSAGTPIWMEDATNGQSTTSGGIGAKEKVAGKETVKSEGKQGTKKPSERTKKADSKETAKPDSKKLPESTKKADSKETAKPDSKKPSESMKNSEGSEAEMGV